MSRSGREHRRMIESAVDAFAGGVDGKLYTDGASAAVYRLEPPGSECIALACLVCSTVTIRPGAPRLERLTMACNQCGQMWALEPPPEVVAFGRSGILVVGVDGGPSRLS